MTDFNTAVGNGKYSLTFNTDNHFYYQHIQQAARDCVDGILPPTTSSPTNADRIRAMSDEELAEFLILSPEMEFELCRYCINGNTAPDDRGQCLRPNGHCYANDRCEAFKKWLKREATT